MWICELSKSAAIKSVVCHDKDLLVKNLLYGEGVHVICSLVKVCSYMHFSVNMGMQWEIELYV